MDTKIITSVNNPFIQSLIKLKDKKYREINKQFIIEGYHLVEEAAKSNHLLCVLACNESDLKSFKCDTYKVNEQIINKLSSTVNPQPIIGIVSFINKDLSIVQKSNSIVILDNINDPGNLGTIIRTSAALGYDTLIISNNSVDLYNDKTIRASQGTIFKTNIVVSDLTSTYKECKKNNIELLCTALNGNSVPLSTIKPSDKFGVIFGNEAHGVSMESIESADKTIIIPMKQDVESLNVSVASAIILYELKNTL